MGIIHVLDEETIDKIAAGEVVEKPASVVKELVENAIDANATSITVEIKEGGISFLRITDNGNGIDSKDLRTAFLRHATSKIKQVEDLDSIESLGFRGEALSSISAVAQVEVITKTKEAFIGNRMIIEGGRENSFEEIGAPSGTTFIIRNLFFNTPVRRKFLKQPSTEGGYIVDLIEKIALSRPDISFKLIVGNQTKLYTTGNGNLQEVIYRIYGKEVASNLIPVKFEENGLNVTGFLGNASLVRSNRNNEIIFLNGRYIKSQIVIKAIEEGYKEYLMQHKFPVCILHLNIIDKSKVDVNVHPTKMEVRFSDSNFVIDSLSTNIKNILFHKEMIPEVIEKDKESLVPRIDRNIPEPFEQQRLFQYKVEEVPIYTSETPQIEKPIAISTIEKKRELTEENKLIDIAQNQFVDANKSTNIEQNQFVDANKSIETKVLSVENRIFYKLIGQVFQTYWLIEFEEKLFIIDQHAAHEKVKYERLIKQYRNKEILTQNLYPPMIVTLTGNEQIVWKNYKEKFIEMGFEIEDFGGNEFAIRSVPIDLYGCNEKEMFLEVLDELSEGHFKGNLSVVEEKIASMSCKAAVKGNNSLSVKEVESLIDELLTLENPYNCPHGRPTIISMSKYEMEKKFKR